MRKASTKRSRSALPRRSSRRRNDSDVLVRVHEAGRVMEQKRKKLGMSPGEYLKHLTSEMRKKGHSI